MRCELEVNCAYFSFWSDGGCHLAGADATLKALQAPVISGPAHCHQSGREGISKAATEGIRQNVSAKSALDLWKIDGLYYDLSPLLKGGHPGGPMPLMQTRGTDVSLLFRVQHLGERPRIALSKYLVNGSVNHGQLVKQDIEFSFEPDGFYETLKGRVRDFLKDKNGDTSPRKASWRYLSKLGLHMALFTGTWYRVIFYPMNIPTLLACLANALSRMELTGLGHDAIHGILASGTPYFQHAFASAAFRGFVNFGSTRWHEEHVIHHHPNTKTEDDPDENLNQNIPIWRLTNATAWNPLHSYPVASHIGVAVLLPILNGLNELPKLFSPFAFERLDGGSALSAVVFLHLMPLLLRPMREGVVVFALTSMLPALMTVLAFHVTHLAGHLEVKYQPGADWGEHQMRTSNNFNSPIGGTLDLQIEHHLFPMLSYENQQSVVPIVKQTAQEFGIPYFCYESFLDGVYNHLSYMSELGRGVQSELDNTAVA
jgi:linoleoyl-CoA desaturase